MANKGLNLGLGARIRRWRLERELSQGELGKKCGSLTATSIYRYETDRVVPGIDILVRIADALDVPVDLLVGDQVRPPPKAPQEIGDFLEELTGCPPKVRKVAMAAARAVISESQATSDE